MSSGQKKSTLPKEVVAALGEFNTALTELEQALDQHFAVDFEQHLRERNALEMAKIDVMSIFALTSLGWTLSAMKGEDPKESGPVMSEMVRSKVYNDRLKTLQARKTAPRVNAVAAKNFVRNALWEIPQSDEAEETTETSTKRNQPAVDSKKKK